MALISRLLDPLVKCLSHFEKGLRVLGLIGQVLEFPRIGFQVVQLLGCPTGSKEKALLKIIELAFLSPVADRKVSRFVVLVGAGVANAGARDNHCGYT